MDRNTKLKDEMREKDVVQLVDAWMGILEGVKSGSISNDIGEVCLEVVGQYVEWIDINLVSNIIQITDYLRRTFDTVILDCE